MSQRRHRLLAELPEQAIIDRLVRHFGPAAAVVGAGRRRPRSVALGIGDDCALVAPQSGQQLAVTTDATVEQIDFTCDRFPADAIGWRCLAQNLSDLAAMGALPIGFVLTTAAPPTLALATLDAIARGMARLARAARCPLIGGDLSATGGPLTLSITALGQVPARVAHRRAGARPGDRLWVSGELGASARALGWLLSGRPRHPATSARAVQQAPVSLRPAVRGYLRPLPRLALGQALRGVASAAIDISDGLLIDLRRLASSSRVAIDVDSAALPLSTGVAIGDALVSGEEYELLFTAPLDRTGALQRAARRASVAVHCIGRVRRGRGIRVDGRPAHGRGGFDHFGRGSI